MKKVLLLGDSIRENYQELVTAKLAGRAEVVHPAENCRFSAYTLGALGGWLGEPGTPDIIHWNNGLWDTCIRYAEDGPFTPVDDYVRNLSRILRELKKTGATIIFATTTPCKEGRNNQDLNRIIWYNHNAVELMKREGIAVNDLFSVVYANSSEYICEDALHLSEAGKEACADAVVKVIEKYL